MRIRDFKRTALDSLSGHWFVAIITAIVASLLGAFGSSITVTVDQNFVNTLRDLTGINLGAVNIWILIAVAAVILIASVLISCAITVGYAEFNIALIDGDRPRVGMLFNHFNRIKTTLWASVLVYLRVLVGTIFFVIPGIIAAYKYAMVYYVIAENPHFTAKEALARSKEIMRGNKWRLFCLQISFFGWYILGLLTLGLAYLVIVPYHQAAHAALYRKINW